MDLYNDKINIKKDTYITGELDVSGYGYFKGSGFNILKTTPGVALGSHPGGEEGNYAAIQLISTHSGGGWIDWIHSTSTDSDYDGRIRFRQSTGFEFDLKTDSSYTRIFKFLNGDLLVGDGTDNQINFNDKSFYIKKKNEDNIAGLEIAGYGNSSDAACGSLSATSGTPDTTTGVYTRDPILLWHSTYVATSKPIKIAHVKNQVTDATYPWKQESDNAYISFYDNHNNGYYIGARYKETYGSSDFNKLDIVWHTGIRIGAEVPYGGIRFYDNNPTREDGSDNGAKLLFSIGKGDRDVRVEYADFNVVQGSGYASGSLLTSDDRLKINEELLVNATSTILKLRPQIYEKANELNNPIQYRKEAGLIVQEIYYEIPELRYLIQIPDDATLIDDNKYRNFDDIQNDPDYINWGSTKASLDYNSLITYLIRGFQEQNSRIVDLETENEQLKNEITQIKNILLSNNIS